MNNLKFFVDLEKKTNKKGIGDIREASFINIKKPKLFIQREGEEKIEIPIGPAPGIIYDEEALYHPVFCSMGKEVKYDRINQRQFNGKIVLERRALQDFIDAENQYQAVIISDVCTFLERVYSAINELHIDGKYGMVHYKELCKPNFINDTWILGNTFIKDIRFKD